MRKILSAWVLVAGLLGSFTVGASENLSFFKEQMTAGRASLTNNGFVIERMLGTANFSPELRWPLQLIYQSFSDSSGLFGYAWSVPQLESSAVPQENGVMWTTPWGTKIRFFTKENVSRQDMNRAKAEIAEKNYLVNEFLDWKAEGQLGKGDWKFTGMKNYEGWEFIYKNVQLSSVKSPKGNQIDFHYQGRRLAAVSQSGVKFIELKYEQRLSEISINGVSHKLTFETANMVKLPVTLAGKAIEFKRPRLTSIATGDLAPVNLSYDAQSYLTGISQGDYSEELSVENETLEQRRAYLTAARELLNSRKMGVRAERKLISGRLAKDGKFTYSYDPEGKPGKVFLTNKLERQSVCEYNVQSGALAVTDFNGLKRITYYYMRHNVPYNRKIYQVKNARNQVEVRYQYDKETGNVTTITDQFGNDVIFDYNENNLVSEVYRQASGSSAKEPLLKLEYDKNKNPLAVSRLNAEAKAVTTQKIRYNQNHMPTHISDGRQSTAVAYNKFSYPVTKTDVFGQKISYEYDKFNRLTGVVDKYGTTIRFTLNSAGRVTRIARNFGSQALSSLEISYDLNGRAIAYTDQDGKVKKFEHDQLGRIIKEIFPDDTKVEYSYNELGQLATVLDQNDHAIQFGWNQFGLSNRATAAKQLTDYLYDKYGKVKQVDSRFEGQEAERSIKYQYDKYGRVIKISYAKDETETFKYDNWNRLTASSRGERKAVYKYDYFNRLIEKAETSPDSKITTTYEYNAWGQRTLRETRTNALTLKESRSYDKFGRLERIESGNDVVKYEYNSQNQLTRRTANNIPVYYTYTPQGRLETKALGGVFTGDKAIATLQYFYRPDGQITARSVNGKKQEYQYDKRGQLLEVIGSEKYTYDPAGNILSKTINGVTTTFTYDAANQLAASVKDGQTTEYRYDAAGRLVTEGDKNYNYGYLDKILKVVDNGQTTATFDYHVNGQIASVNRNNQSENFLWDGLALIHRGETSLVNEPAITGGNPILANGKPILEDLLGTSLGALKDGNFEANELTSFGEPVNPSSDNYFTGKPYIGELGYAFLFRNYRPEKGKWQTQDPIGYPDGWNNFTYCNNEVIESVDFLGTWTLVANQTSGSIDFKGFNLRIYDSTAKSYLRGDVFFSYNIFGSNTSSMTINISMTLKINKVKNENGEDIISGAYKTASVSFTMTLSVNEKGEVSVVLHNPSMSGNETNNRIINAISSPNTSGTFDKDYSYDPYVIISTFQKYGDSPGVNSSQSYRGNISRITVKE